jgi:hypothetical protein
MFEKASRLKLRFDTPQGGCLVEDLWDLPLTSERRANLDDIAKGLNKTLKENDNESFVVKTTKTNELLQLKLAIVKHIIKVRLNENEIAAQAKANKEKKQKLLTLIEQKKDAALSAASIEELEAQIANL